MTPLSLSPVDFKHVDVFSNVLYVCVCLCVCMRARVHVGGWVDVPACLCPCDSVGSRCDILDLVVSC